MPTERDGLSQGNVGKSRLFRVDSGPGQLGDDAYDSAGYGLYTHFTPGQKSKEAEVRYQAAQIADPLERWSYVQVHGPREDDNRPFRQRFKMRWEQEL